MEDGGQEKVFSLPQLQNLMRRDPEAYKSEFEQQWSHFNSMLEIFKLKPQKPHKTFAEHVMFLAHVSTSFPGKAEELPTNLMDVLDEHSQIMHADMRRTLVSALVLLRNRGVFPCLRTLPLYFKLFALQDKGLRKMLFAHITRDIVQMHKKSKSQQTTAELRTFFFSRMRETDTEIARRACAVFISLYRQNVWSDAHVVNLMSAGLLHPDVKIAAALAHLFLGNKTKGLDGILEESDGSDNEGLAQEALTGIAHAKKTGNREKRVKRAKKAAKKAIGKHNKKDANTAVSFVAIDLIHDPHTLADRLVQRISKSGEPFLFRLLVMHLAARLIGRHDLLVSNMYPLLMRYLVPTQNEVTKILACLVESSHRQVPLDELKPVVVHVMKNFVTDSQTPEVIEVGLNTIAQVCGRTVNLLTEDELADLAGFRKHKKKGVKMAVRSLVNVYRELHPELLERSLRGKAATMALSRGEMRGPQVGQQAAEGLDGMELLVEHWKKRKKNEGEMAPEGKDVLTQKLLTDDDLKTLRKLRLQRSVELQMGRKRKRGESESSSSSDSDGEADGEDEEKGMTGRLPGAISGDQLKSKKKKNNKQQRLASVEAGRNDFKESLKEKSRTRKGGKTNLEKNRNKPLMMARQGKSARKKLAMSAKQKMHNLKTHVSTLKKKTGGKMKRRR